MKIYKVTLVSEDSNNGVKQVSTYEKFTDVEKFNKIYELINN